jgi:DNA-binding NtrC family response regulator
VDENACVLLALWQIVFFAWVTFAERKWVISGERRGLRDYTWPGNVRQLQHLIERLTILAPHRCIDAEAAHEAIAATETREHGGETLAEAEAEQIRRVLAATGGNKSRAARLLGIERKTLYRKLESMGL